MTVVEQPQAGSSIRSFHVDVPAEALTELRHQLAATCFGPPGSWSQIGRRVCS